MSNLADDSVRTEATLREFNRDRNALAVDIQTIVEKLLADSRARVAFARVGLEEAFSEEETKLIYDELGFARAFEPTSVNPATAYSHITQALARRTVSGMYSNVHCDEATAFVKRNAFPLMSYKSTGHLPRQCEITFNKVPFADYLRVFKYIANSKAFAEYEQRLRNTDYQSGDSQEYKDLEYEIRTEEIKIFRRHGLIGNFSTCTEILVIRHRGLDVNNQGASEPRST